MSSNPFYMIFCIINQIQKVRFNLNMDIKKQLGKRIKELRQSKNISQENVAEFLGINPSNYSRIETGTSYPRPENLEKICEILSVSARDLFDFEHHKDILDIKAELIDLINKSDDLAILIYKFVKSIYD